jgi:hypothetical protein
MGFCKIIKKNYNKSSTIITYLITCNAFNFPHWRPAHDWILVHVASGQTKWENRLLYCWAMFLPSNILVPHWEVLLSRASQQETHCSAVDILLPSNVQIRVYTMRTMKDKWQTPTSRQRGRPTDKTATFRKQFGRKSQSGLDNDWPSVVTWLRLKTKRLSTNIKLIFHKSLISSVLTYASPTWEFAADTHPMEMQHLQNMVLCTISSFPRHAPIRHMNVFPNSVRIWLHNKIMWTTNTSNSKSWKCKCSHCRETRSPTQKIWRRSCIQPTKWLDCRGGMNYC